MIKKIFIFLLVCISLSNCIKDPVDPINGKTTQTLTNADFNNDLILEDRNDGVDYFIDFEAYVDQSLTIKPGVVIEFGENAGLNVDGTGSIEAIGLPESPIRFTGKIKSKGAWIGILVQTTSLKNRFKHCIIEYAGSDSWGNDIKGGLCTWADAALNVDDCTFKSNKHRGINLYYRERVDLRSFDNNTFESNDSPILLDPSQVHLLGITNNYADDNNTIAVYENKVFGDGEDGKTKTWRDQGIPYRILGRVDIAGKNNLTIEAGTTLEFEESGYIYVYVDASFSSKGTATNQVILSGVNKQSGSWGGIEFHFTNSSKNLLENTIVEYGGGSNREFEDGVIYMWGEPNVVIKDCIFRNNGACIFNSQSGDDKNPNLTESGNTVTNSGSLFCQ